MSSFNLHNQNQSVEDKIVVLFEKISEAMRVMLWESSKKHNLSPIQIQVLIFILFHKEEYCQISYLAQEFNLTKATISDSVKNLIEKGLVKKIINEKDKRSYTLKLTSKGKKIAEDTSFFANTIKNPISVLNLESKELLFQSLTQIVSNLNQQEVISVQRMCFSCVNYVLKDEKHFCNLLNQELHSKEIRIDCPEHVAV